MKSSERDERLVDAAERSAEADERSAHALEAPERRLRAEKLDAAFPSPRRLFGGERGAVALLRSIPGFAGLWTRILPDSHIRWDVRDRDQDPWAIVTCAPDCGQQLALRPGHLGDCGCGRFFFHVGDTIRVRKFETA